MKVSPAKRSRLAYSSEAGPLCRHCGATLESCRCKPADQAVPDRIVVVLRIEKSGRKGKTVTVIDGLPRNETFLKALAKELKSACGSGGSVGEQQIEIQGDHRERLHSLLEAKGWRVKGWKAKG